MVEVADDLSKCCIKEVEKPAIDRTGSVPINRLPFQAPQNIQGLMIDLIMYFATMHHLHSSKSVVLIAEACYIVIHIL